MVHKVEKKTKTISGEEITLPTTPEEIELEEEGKDFKKKDEEEEGY